MSLFFIFLPMTAIAAILERPKKVKVYNRKRTVHEFI